MPEPQLTESRFAALTEAIVGAALDRDPVEATYLGDHRRDGLLPDPSSSAALTRAAELRVELAELDAIALVDADLRVDVEVLRTALTAELLELDDIREAEWNPMLHNPGNALHALLTREFAPLADRLSSVAARLAAVPEYLAAARTRLDVMSRPHLETAIDQLDGTIGILDGELSRLAAGEPVVGADIARAAEPARVALVEHRDWLAARLPDAHRDPRLGAALFSAKLALTLDTAFDPADLLSRATAELDRVTAEMIEHAGQIAGVPRPDAETVREVLATLATDAPNDATVLELCRAALNEATAFVHSRDLVTVHADPIEVVAMPEIDRGVAVAYCRDNGPLEQAVLPTEFAVSPAPAGWSTDRIASFYREYNRHMLHNLAVHEAMPGHALQLMHANRRSSANPVRAVWRSGTFIEGWAVYAEELMVRHGYRAEGGGLLMQQLKMRLRSIINAILDIRFHCDDLDEAAALELMTRRGFQEEGEAVGKWRRVQLSATQLCTYFVGYVEMSEVATALSAAHPDWSQWRLHDAMLAHGCPPARHLRSLLGLPAAG